MLTLLWNTYTYPYYVYQFLTILFSMVFELKLIYNARINKKFGKGAEKQILSPIGIVSKDKLKLSPICTSNELEIMGMDDTEFGLINLEDLDQNTSIAELVKKKRGRKPIITQ